MNANEYQCAMCKGIFEKIWSDEEALKEMETNFGPFPENVQVPCIIVCDDCYKKEMGL